MILSNSAVAALVRELKVAKSLNDKIQEMNPQGSVAWHICESLDDRLHGLLEMLGD